MELTKAANRAKHLNAQQHKNDHAGALFSCMVVFLLSLKMVGLLLQIPKASHLSAAFYAAPCRIYSLQKSIRFFQQKSETFRRKPSREKASAFFRRFNRTLNSVVPVPQESSALFFLLFAVLLPKDPNIRSQTERRINAGNQADRHRENKIKH